MKIKLGQRYNLQQRIIFFRQLAVILQSGLPLLQGLRLLEQHADKKLRFICYKLQNSLRRGCSLVEAMEQEPAFFPSLAIKLVAAGEESGELHNVLAEAAEYYQKQLDLRNFIVKSLLYPMLVLIVAAVVILVFGVYILPVLAQSYVAMGIKPTAALNMALFLQTWVEKFPLLAVSIGSISLCLLYCVGRYLLHIFLRSSLSGNFHGLLLEVKFCKLLALLLESGLQITQAVTIVADTMEEKAYARQLQLLNERLKRGITIEKAAGASFIFSPLLMELVCVGASTGYLPQMLSEAALISEKRLEEQLGRFKQLFVPLLLLFVAMIAAGVVTIVVGPLFSMLAALPE